MLDPIVCTVVQMDYHRLCPSFHTSACTTVQTERGSMSPRNKKAAGVSAAIRGPDVQNVAQPTALGTEHAPRSGATHSTGSRPNVGHEI